MEIVEATGAEPVDQARELFVEYQKWLGIPLCFQDFDEELAALPGKYAPPDGRLLLAFRDGELAGCVALRKLHDGVCEMKRLYVRDEFRGMGIGAALVERLISEARSIGYRTLRLDTYPPKMSKAVVLYESYGFRKIDPYYHNPYGETMFMELDLGD